MWRSAGKLPCRTHMPIPMTNCSLCARFLGGLGQETTESHSGRPLTVVGVWELPTGILKTIDSNSPKPSGTRAATPRSRYPRLNIFQSRGNSIPQTMSDSATTSGAADLLCWPVRADLPNISDTLADALVPLEDAYTLVQRLSGQRALESRRSPTYTYERIADDLDELRDHLGYERVGVLAHSMGGFIGLNYGLRHPEACAGMVLVGTTPTGNPGKIAVPALRALGPTRAAKALALAAWYLAAWSWRSESKDKHAGRYRGDGRYSRGNTRCPRQSESRHGRTARSK